MKFGESSSFSTIFATSKAATDKQTTPTKAKSKGSGPPAVVAKAVAEQEATAGVGKEDLKLQKAGKVAKHGSQQQCTLGENLIAAGKAKEKFNSAVTTADQLLATSKQNKALLNLTSELEKSLFDLKGALSPWAQQYLCLGKKDIAKFWTNENELSGFAFDFVAKVSPLIEVVVNETNKLVSHMKVEMGSRT